MATRVFVLIAVVAGAAAVSAAADQRDFYEVLGVSTNADERAIKKAYRRLAREYHPDKHPPADKERMEAKFIELANAYDVLSDADKRQRYDDLGDTGDASFSSFKDAFKHAQTHGAVEDTPLNWAAVGAVLLLSVAVPVAMVRRQAQEAARSKRSHRDQFLDERAAAAAAQQRKDEEARDPAAAARARTARPCASCSTRAGSSKA